MTDFDDYEQSKLKNVLSRFKNPTRGGGGAVTDKRKETSRINAAKARAAKLAGQQAKKVRMPVIEESDDDEEEEDETESEEEEEEEFVLKKKGKVQKGRGRGGAPPASDDRLSRIEQTLSNLAMQKVVKKKKVKKAPQEDVTSSVAPTPAPSPVNQHTKVMKQHIISWD